MSSIVKNQKRSTAALLGRRIWLHGALYIMFIPCVVYFILFNYIPMAGIVLAFKDFSFRKGIWGSPWVGFDYFKMFFNSYDAQRLIRNTLIIGFMKCVLEFPFAIILALMINELRNARFKKISQTVSYLPHFMSSVIIITMLQRMLAPNTGAINQLIGALGGDSSTFYLMEKKYFLPILFLLDLWKNMGWDSIIFLAAMSGVDPALYEASQIDGCGKLKRMWHITLPGIRSTIGVLFILGVGGLLSSGFDQIYLLRTPGNMEIADTLDVYVVRTGISGGQFGYATAIGLIQGVVGLILVMLSNKISKRITEVGIW
ncbi:MAG: sugar ABC transporter permease [Clostridiales bacterium]|nr:sugar ABC transporter permease [Clostridiales bacterium]